MTKELSDKEVQVHSCGGHHGGEASSRPGAGKSLDLKVKLLTISDRAYTNSYESGDLSGKAMQEVIEARPELFD